MLAASFKVDSNNTSKSVCLSFSLPHQSSPNHGYFGSMCYLSFTVILFSKFSLNLIFRYQVLALLYTMFKFAE